MLSNYFFTKKIVFNKPLINRGLLQLPSNNIQLFFYAMLFGFCLACGCHTILGAIGMKWPWNSFLFMPSVRFSDWYDSVARVASLHPYYNGPALGDYFPVAYVLLKAGVGHSAFTSIAIYFSVSIALLILTASLARTLVCVSHIDSKFHCLRDIILLVSACLMSYPVIFALDRGSLDLWIALLCTLFVVTQLTRFELLGLVGLSIAIALKGYPAAFLLLLFSDRKYKSAIFCSFLILLMTIITLYFMWDGFERNLNGLINNINMYYQVYVIGAGSFFASSDPYNAIRVLYYEIVEILQKVFSLNIVPLSIETLSISIIRLYTLLSCAFLFIMAYFVLLVPSVRWKKVTAVCLIAILFPCVANDYKLCLLYPGLYLLLFENINSRTEKISCILFCLLMIPKSYLFLHGKSISMIINPLLLIALAYQVTGTRKDWQPSFQLIKNKIFG